MEQEFEKFKWSVLEGSFIRHEILLSSAMVIHSYQGMTTPIKISNTEYKVRVTLKYYWKRIDGWLMIEAITYAKVNSEIKEPLFVGGADKKSVEVLSFLLKMIDRRVSSYVKIQFPQYNAPPMSKEELKKSSHDLLKSRFQWEN